MFEQIDCRVILHDNTLFFATLCLYRQIPNFASDTSAFLLQSAIEKIYILSDDEASQYKQG